VQLLLLVKCFCCYLYCSSPVLPVPPVTICLSLFLPPPLPPFTLTCASSGTCETAAMWRYPASLNLSSMPTWNTHSSSSSSSSSSRQQQQASSCHTGPPQNNRFDLLYNPPPPPFSLPLPRVQPPVLLPWLLPHIPSPLTHHPTTMSPPPNSPDCYTCLPPTQVPLSTLQLLFLPLPPKSD